MEEKIYDTVIIGGGPGGYTAALYCARSGLSVAVLEKLAPGGQMATTGQVDNYPGFEDGVDGFELGEKMQRGAERFGAATLYDEVTGADLAAQPVLVDFWAPWCGYCRRLAPVVERLEKQWAGKLLVAKLDIDEAPALAERYGIDTIPTLLVFQGGKAGEPLVNPGSMAQIEAWLAEGGVE